MRLLWRTLPTSCISRSTSANLVALAAGWADRMRALQRGFRLLGFEGFRGHESGKKGGLLRFVKS